MHVRLRYGTRIPFHLMYGLILLGTKKGGVVTLEFYAAILVVPRLFHVNLNNPCVVKIGTLALASSRFPIWFSYRYG
jgi:hypothetical protein